MREVQNEGVCWAMLPPRSLGDIAACLFQLLAAPEVPRLWQRHSSGHLLPVSLHVIFPLCMSVSQFSSSHKDSGLTGLGARPIPV